MRLVVRPDAESDIDSGYDRYEQQRDGLGPSLWRKSPPQRTALGFSSHRSQAIERALHATATTINDVGVNHRGRDILVSQQFLDCADIVAILNEMRREAMT